MRIGIAAALTMLCLSSTMASAADPATPLAQSPAAALLAQPVTFSGTLGNQKIQMHLRLKTPVEEGIEGDYFLFGQSRKILLAGETENDILAMEESENGSDISGQWDGKIEGRSLRGIWQSADGTMQKPFELHAVPIAAVATKKHLAKKIERIAAH